MKDREISISCETGIIIYHLERKRVKNLNLRVHRDGQVFVSAAPIVPIGRINAFVMEKAAFIRRAQERFARMEQKTERPLPEISDEACRAAFTEIMERVYPAFQAYGIPMPALRIRNMRSRWGSCLYGKVIITLNKQLARKPEACIEYVVVHEFCHFLVPNHSRDFYALLSRHLPDWKERRNRLNREEPEAEHSRESGQRAGTGTQNESPERIDS